MYISFIPKFLINKITKNNISQLSYNIILSSILLLIILQFLNIEFLNKLPHFCLIKELTGINCPACGITRSLICLSNFEIQKSIQYNINGIVFIFLIFIQIPLRILVIFNNKYFNFVENLSNISSKLMIISLIIVWLFSINS